MWTILILYLSYVGYYLCKKNYGYWVKVLIESADVSKAQVGGIQSSFEMTLACSKLVAGPVVDACNPKVVLCFGLALSGICNILLSYVIPDLESMRYLAILNAIGQSVGWPAVASIFMQKITDPKQRGLYYSILSTSQNVGAGLLPLLMGPVIEKWGGSATMWMPGFISLSISGVLLLALPNTKKKEIIAKNPGKESEPVALPWTRVLRDIFGNPRLILVGIIYFFVSIVRSGIADWCGLFLLETQNFSISQVGTCLFALEVGGCVGSLLGGMVSDTWFNGSRSPVISLFCGMGTIVVGLFQLPHLFFEMTYALYFAIGFCSCTPHVLIGLYSREITLPNLSNSAGGFVKFIGQLGAALSGAPLGAFIDTYGWEAVLQLYTVCLVLATLCGVGLMKLDVKSKEKQE